MSSHQAGQGFYQMVAHSKGVFLQSILFNHIQYGHPDCAGYWIASKSIEVFHSVIERCCNLARGYNSSQRMTVTDWFAHRHDIRHNILGFKSPEMSADTAKSDLNFVGNTNAASVAYIIINIAKIILWQDNLTAATQNGFANECANLSPGTFGILCSFSYRLRIQRAGVCGSVRSSINIGHWHFVDVIRRAASTRTVEFVRTDFD